MSALENIGAFAGGASRGAGRGLDLYQQFEQIKEQGEQRKKQKEFEGFVAELAKSGEFKRDRLGALSKAADYVFSQGNLEAGEQITQLRTELGRAKGDAAFLRAGALAKYDPVGATQGINEGFQAYDLSDRLTTTRMPDGRIVVAGTQGGGDFKAEFADPDDFSNFVKSTGVSIMLPAGAQADLELKKEGLAQRGLETESDIKKNEALIAQGQQGLDLEALRTGAQVESSKASALASRAQAVYNTSRIGADTAKDQAQAAENIARTNLLTAQTEQIRSGADRDPAIDTLAKSFVPELDPLTADAAEYEQSQQRRQGLIGLASLLQQNMAGLNNVSATGTAANIISNPDSYRGEKENGVPTGVLVSPTGERINVGKLGIDIISTLRSATAISAGQ